MEEMCIHVFYPGPNLSKRAKKARTYPYLLRKLDINRPNQVWSIDITYVGTLGGFVYMVAIIDWYSRFIVGWSISNTLQSDFIIRTMFPTFFKLFLFNGVSIGKCIGWTSAGQVLDGLVHSCNVPYTPGSFL
jgi:hypothetical protein